jgi:uncharacterized damage-inducible protein DinB
MPEPVAVAPTYATGDLRQILAIEQRQIEDTVADLTDEQMRWRPHPKAKSALDILWHLAYAQTQDPPPPSKATALAAFRQAYDGVQAAIATPEKLDTLVTWWTGEQIPFRGVVWSEIRHRSYHLGELVYLRQVLGLDEPKYYHER